MRWPALFAPLLAVVGCAAEPRTSDDDDAPPATCEYPQNAVEPMALGEVLSPYRWAQALHSDGTDRALDLALAFCDEDEFDWDPFKALLFVSIPAW